MKSPPDASDPGSSSIIRPTAASGESKTQLPENFSLQDIIVPPEEPSFWSKTSLIQFGYGVWINQTCVIIGLTFGFTSAAIPMLRKSTIQMNLSDESWIAGSITLCAPIGSLLAGYLMDKYGRKHMFTMSEAPVILGWFCIGFAKSATIIVIGRVITGIGLGCMFTAPRAYLTEISLPNMRGVIGALPNIFVAFGLIIMAGLAVFLDWRTLCYISGAYSILLTITYFFLPETPHYVLMSSPEKAKEVLKKFRSKRYDVDTEMKMLLDFREKNNIHSLTMRQKFATMVKPSVYKPFMISFVYITLTHLVGVNVILMWGVEMLEITHASVNVEKGFVILTIIRLVAGVLTSVIIYKVKRRVLAILSAVGVGISSISIWLYIQVEVGSHITPLYLYIGYITFACLGYYTLPFMMMNEMLPLQHRGFLCGVNITAMDFMIFGMNKSYPYMRESIGLDNVMAIFGVISLVGAIILYFILPETSELTLQEIEEYFNKRRPVLTTSRKLLASTISLANLRNQSKKSLLKIN